MAGGVLAAADLLADVSRGEVQALKNGVEEGGLPRPRGSRHGGDLALQLGMGEVGEGLHPLSRVAGQDEGTVAHLPVEGGDLGGALGGQLALAHDDHGLDTVELQDGQQLIHCGDIGIGGGGGDDHQHHVQIGQRGADQAVFAGENIVDHQTRALGRGDNGAVHYGK